MYSDEEILKHLTEGEGRGFLGRSMYDAIIEKINKKEAMYDNLEVDYRLAQEEIERLNNIIKEVREYVEDNVVVYAFNNKDLPHWEFNDDNVKELLEILDKGE